MILQATSTFTIKNWEEKPFSEVANAPKLTKASVTKSYAGDMKGTGDLEYLMIYPDDKTATFYGLERFTGSIGNKTGSFILEHKGKFENAVASATCIIVPLSGTGPFKNIKGSVTFSAGHEKDYPIILHYSLS